MKLTTIAAAAVVMASFGAVSSSAQNLRDVQAPAEFPPASYKGNQYVDSKGCVYIRAGIDGNVTWVPRVNRQRRLLCGQTPTQVSRGGPVAAPQTKPPVQLTIDTPTSPAPTQTAAAQPAPPAQSARAGAVAATPSPAPAPTVFTASNGSVAPTAEPQVTTRRTTSSWLNQPAPSPAPAPTVFKSKSSATVAATPQPTQQRRTAAAPSAAPTPTVFKTSKEVRNPSPQPIAAATRQPAAQPVAVQQATRFVPTHVYNNQPRADVANIPKGYRPAWDDDRLNPFRAEQTAAGVASMGLIWTNTVPRRLINKRTGRDVTASTPLVYPFTDAATQKRELGDVTIVRRDGTVVKRVARNSRSKARKPKVSTRSASSAIARSKPQPAPKGQYIQVGTFGVPANARATAQQLARSGLPTRMGTLKRGGKTYRVVLAGPFGSSTDTHNALAQARAVGFRDAFVR